MDRYRINEVFYSLQGEGVRAGTACVFVRFAGCNLNCKRADVGFDCDTHHTTGRWLTKEQLLSEMFEVGGAAGWCVLTGGEPALQVGEELVAALRGAGWSIAVETNGTIPLPLGIDWVCVSPKGKEELLAVNKVSELKYVLAAGAPLPNPSLIAEHYVLSPAFEAVPDGSMNYVCRPQPGALERCIQLVKENPVWRLSVQQHKAWGMR